MDTIDNVAIPAEENNVPVDNLLLRLSAQEVVDRLLRFLDARNINKDGLFLRRVIQLLDEKVCYCQLNTMMGMKIGEAFALQDRSAGILKKELVFNNQHKEFIYKADEQDGDFLCTTKVLCVLQNRFVVHHNLHIQTKYKARINIEWCNKSSAIKYLFKYICSRKLDKYGTTLRCPKYISETVTGVVRYRVELAVHDGQDGATFVVFDSEMTKLTNKTAATLILEADNGGLEDEIPNCIQEIIGKKFLFQIRVTPFNFTSKHRTFTVSKITHVTPNSEEAVQVEQLNNSPTFQTTLNEQPNSDSSAVKKTKDSNDSTESADAESYDASMVQKTQGSNTRVVEKSLKSRPE
ncbi:unnamed protein product [Arabidopsis halleri]